MALLAAAFPHAMVADAVVPLAIPGFLGNQNTVEDLFRKQHGLPVELEFLAFGDAQLLDAEDANAHKFKIPVCVTSVFDLPPDRILRLNHPLVSIELLDEVGHAVPGTLRIQQGNHSADVVSHDGSFGTRALADLSTEAGARLLNAQEDYGGNFFQIAQQMQQDSFANGSNIQTLLADGELVRRVRVKSLNLLQGLRVENVELYSVAFGS